MADIPRVLITITNGLPSVVAVDGTVQVIIADFDRDGLPDLTEQEVEELFADSVYTGSRPAFDASAAFEKDLLLNDVGAC